MIHCCSVETNAEKEGCLDILKKLAYIVEIYKLTVLIISKNTTPQLAVGIMIDF